MRANNSKAQRALAALSALAVAVALAISTAPGAVGDEHDDRFLDALKRHGIVPAGDPGALLFWAHWGCDQLGQGAKKEHIATWMGQYSPGLSPDIGLNAEFLRVAALYYCPEHKRKAGW
jgi:Protein of unknown function (DUF732)